MIHKESKTDIRKEIKKDPKEVILEKTAKEYFDSAEDELLKGRNNSSVVLYFKSLVALCDLFVFQNTGDTPSSHNSRFSITREKYPDVYNLLDKDFPFYQNNYVQLMSKDLAEAIKDDVKIMAEKTKTKL